MLSSGMFSIFNIVDSLSWTETFLYCNPVIAHKSNIKSAASCQGSCTFFVFMTINIGTLYDNL